MRRSAARTPRLLGRRGVPFVRIGANTIEYDQNPVERTTLPEVGDALSHSDQFTMTFKR
jgi:hypothetical protein